MHLSTCLGPVICLILVFLPTQVLADPSYWIIQQPTKNTQWIQGTTNYATWIQGRGQGIDAFDVELARLSTDGLLFVARNVPTSASVLPVALNDVPPADDYFLLFLNSTIGAMYAISERFTILPAGQSPSNDTTKPSAKNLLATVSVSGSPNPTSSFAYTFAPGSGAESRRPWGAGAAFAGAMGCLWALW